MIPGPEEIVACPHCGGLGKVATLLSGNTFGARVWTDGKQVAPMLPSPPAVARCSGCRKCYWLADAERVGTIGSRRVGSGIVDPAWAAARKVEEPSEEEYYAALAQGLAVNRQQERNLRVLAWWRGNDAFRDTSRVRTGNIAPTSGGRTENLKALARLLGEKDLDDRIMKAEVLRELRDFDAAIDILAAIGSPGYEAVIRQLRSLCESKDMCVRELSFGDA